MTQPGKSDWMDIDEHGDLSEFVGRRIVRFHRAPHSGEQWGDGENTVTIELDDGTELRFTGTGYDASALISEYRLPLVDKGDS